MTRKNKTKGELKGKARLRSEIVEAMRGLHRIGKVTDAEMEKTTLRMLGRAALPKVDDLSPSEIVKVRDVQASARRCWPAFSTWQSTP
jgi:hypothetical protein